MNPVKAEPFATFRGFATHALELDLALAAAPEAAELLGRTQTVRLDQAFSGWRASLDECRRALDLIAAGQARTVREVLLAFPPKRRRAMQLSLVWMAKHGIVDWLT